LGKSGVIEDRTILGADVAPPPTERAVGYRLAQRVHVVRKASSLGSEVMAMPSTRQSQAARRNVNRAQQAARAQKTITKLPAQTRRDLGRQAAKVRQRGGRAGHAYEDRTRQELDEVAKQKRIPGRSKMGSGT